MRVGGVLVILMGLVFLGVGQPARGEDRAGARAPVSPAPRVLGAVFALGWAPCTGPTLAAVLVLATRHRRPAGRGAAWCSRRPTASGLGLPFVLIAAGLDRAGRASGWLRRHQRGIQVVGGVLLVVVGVLLRHRRLGGPQPLAPDRARQRLPGGAVSDPAGRHPAAPRPARLAALDVAAADEHAHRAVPAAAARDRRDPGLDLPAALDRPGPHRRLDRRPPHRRARCSTGSGSSRSTPRRGSPRSTCCCSSRSSAACCPRSRILWHQVRVGAAAAPRAASTGSPPTARSSSTASPRRSASGCGPPCAGGATGCTRTTTRRSRREKGYLRETGNLVFHVALIGVLVGVAVGHLLGWKGDVIVPVGKTFANTLSRYDTFSPGPWVDVNDLDAVHDRASTGSTPTFETETQGRGQFGAPRDFEAVHAPFTDADGAQRAASRSGSTTPSRPVAARSSCSATATPRSSRCATATGTVLYSRRDAVPAAGQQLHLGRRGQGARRLARSSSASPGSSCRPASSTTSRARTRSSPTRSTPQLALTAFEGELFPERPARSRSTRSTPRR